MYRILYSIQARSQISDQVAYFQREGVSNETIDAWFTGLFDRIDDLSQYPLRHAIADEYVAAAGRPIRRLVYGDYLVFYHVNEEARIVEVLAFRHGHRRREEKP